MNACDFLDSGDIELYFYGELDAHDQASVERHVKGCAECRHALDDLSTIRAALSTRPVVAAPAHGDWTGFMAKLDAAVHVERVQHDARLGSVVTTPQTAPRIRYAPQFALAAILAMATMSVAYVMRNGGRDVTQGTAESAIVKPVDSAQATGVATEPATGEAERASEAAFAALSEQHFKRSKLVVLGLANKDARRTRVSDWEYERQLASTLLSDTRLYRLAAEGRGYTALARVMGDLELVLLQTSTAQTPASTDLEQIQRLIAKRDLVSKMDVVTAAGL